LPPARKRKGEPVGWQGLYNTAPILGQCGGCRATIFLAHIDGLHERLDPTPLSQLGETVAWLQGDRTFLWTGLHTKLFRRTTYTIRTQPVPITGVVIRLHRCGNEAALTGVFAASFEPKEKIDGEALPDF
jgi:hypothetical protein